MVKPFGCAIGHSGDAGEHPNGLDTVGEGGALAGADPLAVGAAGDCMGMDGIGTVVTTDVGVAEAFDVADEKEADCCEPPAELDTSAAATP